MCKSLLYAANTMAQTVPVGGIVDFGSPVRKAGCNVALSGGNAVVTGAGYYSVDVNIGFTAVGNVTIRLYQDGVAIPGAVATITGAAGTAYQIVIPAVVRDKCGCDSTITAVVSGVPAAITDAAIRVVKE